MRKLAMVTVGVMALVTACGGGSGDTAPTQPPGSQSPVLDFSAIAGDWSGTGVDGFEPFYIVVSIQSGARRGEKVGVVEYQLVQGVPACTGEWLAHVENAPLYTVKEEIGGCPNVTVELVLDRPTGTLLYRYTADNGDPRYDAEGELTRD